MMARQQRPHAFTVDERGRVYELRAIARVNDETGEASYSKPERGQWVLVPGVLLHDPMAKVPTSKRLDWRERLVWLLLGMLLAYFLGRAAGYFP